jgi:HAD superfamily hydrolase (TIGR01509 family)
MINHNDSKNDNLLLVKKCKGIFWDVDGTLSNSYLLGYNSTNTVLKANGHQEISEEEYHDGTKYCTPTRMAWHVTRNPDDPIGDKLGKEFDDLYVKLVSPETTPLYSGMKDLLMLHSRNKNIYYCAISNANVAYVHEVLKANEISSLFSISLGADNAPAPKPSPDGLLYCCRELNLSPEECIYIGDSPTDGLAAKAACMKSIGVSWGSHSISKIEPHFEVVAHTVDDLRRIIDAFLNDN